MAFSQLIDKNVNLEVKNNNKLRPIEMASDNWNININIVFLLAGSGTKINDCKNLIIKELLQWIPDHHKKFGAKFNQQIKTFLSVDK